MSRAQLTSTVEQNTGGAVAPFLAGKNKIINGDFGIWQRGTTISAGPAYTADRWVMAQDTGSPTYSVSQQAFTAGSAPVAGYEAPYFARFQVTAASTATTFFFLQKVEDVRTFAGQTVTLSLWAKSDSARTMTVKAQQNFGSGGSATISTTLGTISVGTSWARYSVTATLPSIAGKTIGTGSLLEIDLNYPAAVMTNDFWGVQLEAGSVATPFTTASGTLQGELALCQRYYYRITGSSTTGSMVLAHLGWAQVKGTTTIADCFVILPVQMRTFPGSLDYSNLTVSAYYGAPGTAVTPTIDFSTPYNLMINMTAGSSLGTTQAMVTAQASSGYLGISAEL